MTFDDMDVDMAGEVEYIVVDTNILIGDLPLVKALFNVLSIPNLPTIANLLIPSIVNHELDNIQKSDRVEIRTQAREAMQYLLRHVIARRTDSTVPLRVQKQSEVLRTDLNKPDDKVLDCCLMFKPTCSKDIWLWSKDLNLNFNAESNDVRMLSSYSLGEIVRCLGVDQLVEVQEEIKRWRRAMLKNGGDPSPVIDEGGMELDVDFLDHGLPNFTMDDDEHGRLAPSTPSTDSGLALGTDGTRTLLSDYLARWPSQLPAQAPVEIQPATPDTPMSPPSTGLSTPSRLSIYDHHDNLGMALHPLLVHLAVTYERSDRYLTALLDRLSLLERSMFPDDAPPRPPTDEERSMLVSISATRTLVRYFEQNLYGRDRQRERRPRTGEVADAIEVLADLCDSAGLGEDVQKSVLAVGSSIRDS